MTALHPVEAMTDADLLAELNAAFGLTVAILERGAALYAEAGRRELTVNLRSVLMQTYLPRVAAGTLAAAAVVAFADLPRLLDAVATLPVAVQADLAAGKMIDTVMTVGAGPVPLLCRDLSPAYITTAIQNGRLATIAEQAAALDALRKREEARTAALVAKLCRRMEREGGTLTPRRAVEIAVAMGFRPRKEWPAR